MAKPFGMNPRRITIGEAEDLRRDLAELGDLGGIVHNVADTDPDIANTIVGGHARLNVMFGQSNGKFNFSDAQIEIVQKYDVPDEQGTLVHGFLLWQGKRYAYRQVSWDMPTFKRANLAANARGGHWDGDLLSQWDSETLSDFFDVDMLSGMKGNLAIIGNLLASESDADPIFPEYDETVADGIIVCKCPNCGNEHAAKKD